MNSIRYFILLAACFMIQGCVVNGRKLEFPTLPPQITFEYYDPSYKSATKIKLATTDPLVGIVKQWCRENSSGWSKSYDTFAPVFLYSSTNATFNIRKDVVVANVKQSSGKWAQLVKPTPQKLWNEVSTLAADKLKLPGQTK